MALSELYQKEKDSLLRDLQTASTPQAVIGVIQTYLTKITDLKGDYVSGLTRPQARAALSILGIYQEHFRKLLVAFEQVANLASSRVSPVPSRERHSRSSGFPATETIAGVGAASLVAAFLLNPLIAVPLAAVVGLGVAKLLQSDQATLPASVKGNGTVTERHPAPPTPDYSAFLSDLKDLFMTVDTVVEEFSRLEEAARPRPVIAKLEDHPRFLEFLQDLLGWYQRKKGDLPETALQALQMRFEEQLPDLFSEYNIQIHYEAPESDGRDLALFDYEEEVGEKRLTAPTLARPALSKQGEVLLRGRVIEPRSS